MSNHHGILTPSDTSSQYLEHILNKFEQEVRSEREKILI